MITFAWKDLGCPNMEGFSPGDHSLELYHLWGFMSLVCRSSTAVLLLIYCAAGCLPGYLLCICSGDRWTKLFQTILLDLSFGRSVFSKKTKNAVGIADTSWTKLNAYEV